MSVRWVFRLPDSENELEHSLQGEGEFFFKMASPGKWLLPENGFSWEITSPQEIKKTSHFDLI